MQEQFTKAFIYVLVALMGGIGGGLVVPQAAPDIVRPDPATGTQLENLEARVDKRMREHVASAIALHHFKGHYSGKD